MATIKAHGYFFFVISISVIVLILLCVMPEVMNKNNYGMHRSWKKMRRVENHFFFDLLPSFDLHRGVYRPSESIQHSQFSDIIDRLLLSRYLVDRFAYTHFIQFGCKHRNIYQLLPETTMKIRLCADKEEEKYLSSNHAQKYRFDLIVADAQPITNSILESYLTILNEGGAILLTGSNLFDFQRNETKVLSFDDAAMVGQIMAVRGRYDLDLATLDADSGTKSMRFLSWSAIICSISSEILLWRTNVLFSVQALQSFAEGETQNTLICNRQKRKLGYFSPTQMDLYHPHQHQQQRLHSITLDLINLQCISIKNWPSEFWT